MEIRTLPYSLLSLTASLLAFAPAVVRGNAIASWWVDTDELYAPQVFQYNLTTGKIYSSFCNSVSEPIFARNDTTALETTISPIANSSIASLGYLSGSTLETNIFYLASLDDAPAVVTASYTCNATTGRWAPSGAGYNRYISNVTSCDNATEAAPAVDPSGGLSALYLGAAHGARVFFKTAAFQTHYLQNLTSAADDDCAGWSYAGIASNLTTGHEVSSAFLPTKPLVWTIAQTVFANESAEDDALGEVEIGTSKAHGVEDLWSMNRMPTQIIAELKEDNTTAGILSNMSTTADSAYRYVATDSWGFSFSKFAGADARVGTITDSGGIPSVFYIGTDGLPRRYAADSQGHWHEDDSEDDSRWPAADSPSADFGIAYDSQGNRVWLFYESGGALGRAYQSGTSVWEDYARLAVSNSSGAAGDNSTAAAAAGGGAMSATTRVGLGVGLGLGIPVLLAAAGLAFLFYRRRRKSSGAAPSRGGGDDGGDRTDSQQYRLNDASSPVSLDQNQGYWQNGMWVEKTSTAYYAGGPARGGEPLGELPVAPVYEMPADGSKQTLDAYEMPTDKHAQEMAAHKQDPFAEEEMPANTGRK